MTAPRHLLFPVASVDGELDERLALAVLAARPDNRIYIGPHRALVRLARRLRGGVYLGPHPSLSPVAEALDDYRRLKQRDFVFVHFDSDAATYCGSQDRWRKILRRRLDPRQFDADDYLCTWGDFQRQVYRELDPPCRANIRTTGHPGLELYQRPWRSYYDAQARQIRGRFGDFLLIHTDLARANHRQGPESTFSAANGVRFADLGRRLHNIHQWAYKNEQLSHIVRLVHRLHIVFPDISIVLRPHPSEDPAFYRLVFQGLPSVHVEGGGSSAPWVLAARCVIHSGCMAGLKAHLGDVRLINFQPVDAPAHRPFLVDQFGVRCEDEDDVVDCLVELFHSEAQRLSFDNPPLIDHRAKRLLNNLCGSAFPAMLSVLEEAQQHVQHTDEPPELALRTEQTLADAVAGLKRTVPVLTSRRDDPPAVAGFDADDVADRLERLQTLSGNTVQHRLIGHSVVVVEAA